MEKNINLDSLAKDLRQGFDLPNINNYIHDLLSDKLYLELINSFWFRRLFEIPFLGGLSYIESNDKTKTRGHHSVGVALLAYYYSKINNFKKRDERIWIISALLHDIHHLPFSHTMEYALKCENPSFSLHDFDRKIIFAKNANDKGESISDIVSKFEIDIENEAFFLMPNFKRPFIFRSTHNIDTLEGITRVHFKCLHAPKAKNRSLPKRILEATLRNKNKETILYGDIKAFDSFWKIKNEVYTKGIYDKRKVFFERILSYHLYQICNENGLIDKIYTLTDKDLFKGFPYLHSLINLLWNYIKESNSHCCNELSLNIDKKPTIRSRRFRDPLTFSINTRQFKINSLKNADNEISGFLHKRYQVSNFSSNIRLDPNAIENIEEIMIQPISRSLKINLGV